MPLHMSESGGVVNNKELPRRWSVLVRGKWYPLSKRQAYLLMVIVQAFAEIHVHKAS